MALEAGSQTAVDVEPPASPPDPASFARTIPDKQDTRIRAVIVDAARRLVMPLGACVYA